MNDDAEPISYQGVPLGTPVLSASGEKFGTLAKVLEVDSEDVFDGLVVKTHHGERFVDRDQITEITTKYVKCGISDDAAASLPEPAGSPVYDVDAQQDGGATFGDWLGRKFRHRIWHQEK